LKEILLGATHIAKGAKRIFKIKFLLKTTVKQKSNEEKTKLVRENLD